MKTDNILTMLERRLGRTHARQRLGIETDHEARVFGEGIGLIHLENWYSVHSIIRNALRAVGLLGRARRNALDIRIERHDWELSHLPRAFDGFTVLHLSDLHLDINENALHAISERVRQIAHYDICVLTGDYRARTFGDIEASLLSLENLCTSLKPPLYAVLGNHDSIRMVPDLEELGIRVLLNEAVRLDREGTSLYLAGIDDAHYYRVDNIEKAADSIPEEAFKILLSHTPEIYRQAAHAGFDLLLSGHTHGGQICLPGGYPLILDARVPRHYGKGRWHYQQMSGYTSAGAGTSIVDVRLNCPPEITLHRLHCANRANEQGSLNQ